MFTSEADEEKSEPGLEGRLSLEPKAPMRGCEEVDPTTLWVPMCVGVPSVSVARAYGRSYGVRAGLLGVAHALVTGWSWLA